MGADFDTAWAAVSAQMKSRLDVQMLRWKMLFQLKRYEEALLASDEYPEQDSTLPWLLKVEAWRKQGKREESHKLAGLLYEHFPMDPHVVMALAKAEHDMGNAKRSRALHKLAVLIDPGCRNPVWFKS